MIRRRLRRRRHALPPRSQAISGVGTCGLYRRRTQYPNEGGSRVEKPGSFGCGAGRVSPRNQHGGGEPEACVLRGSPRSDPCSRPPRAPVIAFAVKGPAIAGKAANAACRPGMRYLPPASSHRLSAPVLSLCPHPRKPSGSSTRTTTNPEFKTPGHDVRVLWTPRESASPCVHTSVNSLFHKNLQIPRNSTFSFGKQSVGLGVRLARPRMLRERAPDSRQ